MPSTWKVRNHRTSSVAGALAAIVVTAVSPHVSVAAEPPPDLPAASRPSAKQTPPTAAVGSAAVSGRRLEVRLHCLADGSLSAELRRTAVGGAAFRCKQGSALVALPISSTTARDLRDAGHIRVTIRSRGSVSTASVRLGGTPSARASYFANGWHMAGAADGYNSVWSASGMIGSTRLGGDQYYFRFAFHDGSGYLGSWTNWDGPWSIRQSPGQSPITSANYSVPRRTWLAVRMQVWSPWLGYVRDEWLPQTSYTLAQASGIWFKICPC